MPLSTPSVPMNGTPNHNSNHVTRRRARSSKQGATVLPTQHTMVTQTAYDQLARQGQVPPELSALRVRRLCEGRAALGRALLVVAGVMHDHRPGQSGLTPEQIDMYARTWQWARAAHEKLNGLYMAYPLEVRGE